MARVRDTAGERWFELGDQDTKPGAGAQEWYTYRPLAALLRVSYVTPQSGEQATASDDPVVEREGRPQLQIQQAESKKPIFLLKFIGLTVAGGWGEVDTERAIAVDLGALEWKVPAAVGCVKNDFAGQNHENQWVDCRWSSQQQDYVCETNAFYAHEWKFALIEGKKLPSVARTRRR